MIANETFRAVAFAYLALGGALAWFAARAAATPAASPERLIAEFRVVRLAALLLSLSAGTSLGLAAGRDAVPSGALDVTLSAGFIAVGAVAVTRDPRQALTILAAAFGVHAALDVAHRPGLLAPDLGPRWFFVASAVFDMGAGAVCYFPLLRR